MAAYMVESDIAQQETSEQVGSHLTEFIEKAAFGSPEYQAASDYLHLKQLEQSLESAQKNTLSSENDIRRKTHWASLVNITEQEIAIHRSRIYHLQTGIKGYDKAYTFVGIGFEHHLVEAARMEAATLYAGDQEQQNYYVSNIVSTFIGRAEDLVNLKIN